MKKILVTGAAGFIGFHLSKKLDELGFSVIGIDNLNDYYDVNLKKARLKILEELNNFNFYQIDLSNQSSIKKFGKSHKFNIIVNLAAQAGVQYSLENPHVYIDSNITGFLNILELAKDQNIEHLIYASSSSVYGGNFSTPFQESQITDTPQNLYAASKKSNELMSYSYSNLFKIPTTGLRFFTVYGPWGRPDMAYFKFVKNIFEGKPIEIYGNGEMYRDFTYIDDVVNGILAVLDRDPRKVNIDNFENDVPWEIFNIGNNKVVSLEEFITVIENCIGKKAVKKYLDMQPGDMKLTFANIDKIKNNLDFDPLTSINKGLLEFVKWYKTFYKIV